MFEQLQEKYGYLSKFFDSMINTNKVPNSIILHGPDIIAQYIFAIMLAKGANCTGDKNFSCNCQNCRWINANEHPEVMTISKIDSKPEGDESKTVISIKQIDQIKDKLMVSSDYHRFFIFCDADNTEPSIEQKKAVEEFGILNIEFPKTSSGYWIPKGLTNKCFTDIAANALLKSVEEPPANVTFIFLTENIENIISTIVSRSQAFYVSGSSKIEYDFEFLKEPLSNYPDIDRKKTVMISDFLIKYSKDTDKPLSYIIGAIQRYLTETLKNNLQNAALKAKILQDIEKLQEIMTMCSSSVKEQVIADETGYILTN